MTATPLPPHDPADPFEFHDASYVLGSLTTAERREYEAHLTGCRACAAAVGALAGLPGLLGSVPIDIAESLAMQPEDPPPSLLPRLIDRANRRRRRRWVALVGSAAAVIAAFVVVVLITTRPTPTARDAGVPVTLQAAADIHALRADADLISVGWGTRIDLKCTYDEGPGWDSHVYVMTVTDRKGTTESVASWTALPGKTASLTGSTATRLDDIAALDVRDTHGDVLLSWTP